VQDAVVAIAIAASGVAALVAAMVFGSIWSSTTRELFKLLFPGASRETSRIVYPDEVHDAIHPAPAHPPQQRTRTTLRRVLWGVNSTDEAESRG
jgi:hypothetical protein